MNDTTARDAETRPLFLVRVTMPSGAFSVGYGDAVEALQAVANFHQAGLGSVSVYDSEGRKLDVAEVQAAASTTSDANSSKR